MEHLGACVAKRLAWFKLLSLFSPFGGETGGQLAEGVDQFSQAGLFGSVKEVIEL
jgi:hypothetical protein